MEYFQKDIFKTNLSSLYTAIFAGADKFEGEISSENFTLKMPVNGTETYFIEGKPYKIKANNFLIANPENNITAYLNSKKMVSGIYIGLSKGIINNTYARLSQTPIGILDNIDFFNGEIRFLEHSYSSKFEKVGFLLQSLKRNFLDGKINQTFDVDFFFYALSEALINKQKKIYDSLNQFNQIKTCTREELYRRVDIMNQYIHDNYKENIDIDELSKSALLSKFHAIRSYQKIFGVTPYQKIILLRIEEGKRLLVKGYSISEIATIVNFTDYRAFSKVFKKVYNISPTQYRLVFKQ